MKKTKGAATDEVIGKAAAERLGCSAGAIGRVGTDAGAETQTGLINAK